MIEFKAFKRFYEKNEDFADKVAFNELLFYILQKLDKV